MALKKRVAVLISGRGSNMQALAAAARSSGYPAEIAAVISNRPEAAGLAWAEAQNLPSLCIDRKAFTSRDAFEHELNKTLLEAAADLVCCAGFMRLLTAGFVERWLGRLLNIHPSLLPAFKGLDTHAQTLAAGVRIAGCTVHFIVPETDSGPIIAQAAVPVLAGDTPDTLEARILAAEHKLYPHALRLVAEGALRLEGAHVVQAPGVDRQAASPLFSPPLS